MNVNISGDSLRDLVRVLEKNLGLIADINRQDCCIGITFLQCHMITEIGKAEGINLNKLANALNIDKSSLSRSLKVLEKKGLVCKNTGEVDRRYIYITLTESGREKYNSVKKDMRNYFEKILNNIPEEKREQVFESLMILNTAISKNQS